METAVSLISSFRLSHKTDIMSLMSSWKVWPISVLPLDNCPTETERELYNFCNEKTGQTSFSFHRHPFCGRTNMYKEGNKLYSISCYEIKFSSDLLPPVDLAKDQAIFVFYQSCKQSNAFFPGPHLGVLPLPPALHFDYFNNSQLDGGL